MLHAGVTAVFLMAAGLAAAQEKAPDLLYVQAGEGLKWFAVDGRTGALTAKGALAMPGRASSYLRTSPDGRFLYASAPEGQLLVFSIRPDGSLIRRGEAASPGGPCYVDVHPSGRWAATANYGSGTTRLYPVGPDGEIGEAAVLPSGPQSHSVRFHPSGRFFYALSVAGRKISVFQLDETTGKTAVSEFALPGLGPRHLAFSADGRRAFVVHERPLRVSTLNIDPTTGALEKVGDWPLLPPDVEQKPAFAAAEIAVSPSGRFVYASVRDFSKDVEGSGRNGLAVFGVDPGTGALTWVQFAGSGGVSPRGFAADPGGRFVFVLNELSESLRSFRADPESGQLQPAGEPIPLGGRAIGIALKAAGP